MSSTSSFETLRIEQMLVLLERLAGGETELRMPLSERRDHLDALAHGVNAIAQELVYTKEAAESASHAKTRFLAMMSHEIRTPLSAVIGLAEYLQVPGISEAERLDSLERIRSNGRLLLSIVDNVLDLSKIEAGKIQIVKEWVSPAAILQEVARALEHLSRSKGLELGLRISAGVPERIEADPLRMRQVLTNVIGNSIKFTSVGRVSVEMRVATGSGGRPMLETIVSDTGVGIAPDRQGQLFHAFEQAHQGISSQFGGTGLGLALGRRFARLMSGELNLLESSPGVGSVFVFSLPMPERRGPSARKPAPAVENRYVAGERLRGLRVLLAEDSADLQFVFRTFLEREGAVVSLASNGAEALAAAESRTFDVFLLDVNMPVVGGIDATRILREKGLKQPIIALTAHALGLHEEECRAAGYDACLSKPFYPEALTKLILDRLRRA